MTRPFLWLGKRLAYIALAVTGAAVVLFAYTTIVTADITYGDNLGKYTYPSSDCHEGEDEAEDPINVVFYDDAAASNLEHYFDLYHGWGDNGGETQYFDTNGLCHEMDGQPSSRGAGLSRYHARHARGLTSSGAVDIDPPGVTTASLPRTTRNGGRWATAASPGTTWCRRTASTAGVTT